MASKSLHYTLALHFSIPDLDRPISRTRNHKNLIKNTLSQQTFNLAFMNIRQIIISPDLVILALRQFLPKNSKYLIIKFLVDKLYNRAISEPTCQCLILDCEFGTGYFWLLDF